MKKSVIILSILFIGGCYDYTENSADIQFQNMSNSLSYDWQAWRVKSNQYSEDSNSFAIKTKDILKSFDEKQLGHLGNIDKAYSDVVQRELAFRNAEHDLDPNSFRKIKDIFVQAEELDKRRIQLANEYETLKTRQSNLVQGGLLLQQSRYQEQLLANQRRQIFLQESQRQQQLFYQSQQNQPHTYFVQPNGNGYMITGQ